MFYVCSLKEVIPFNEFVNFLYVFEQKNPCQLKITGRGSV